MEQVASPGSLLLTPSTLDRVGGYVDVKPLGPVPVKVLAHAVEGFEVIGAGPAGTRFQATARHGFTRFVGRDDEMATLDAALRRALERHGLAMGVVGAAGVGKSRLCHEFIELCRSRRLPVVEAHCLSHARTAPFGVLRDLLLGALADVASTTRAFLLLNFRPEFHAAWMGRSYYQQLSVAPLGREATREMINGLLGYDPSVVELGELIRGRTQGNPFFIEEVVQALAASGALAGERGAYRWTRSAAELEVPATVQAWRPAKAARWRRLAALRVARIQPRRPPRR